MMNENSPIVVTVSAARSASRGAVPISSRPVVAASERTSSVNTVTPRMTAHMAPSSRTSICMPIATKNTALNTSRIPANVRST